MKILVLDNYDSFTFNLVHYIEKFYNGDVDVFRNDEISLDEINKYDKICLSPGPGLPADAGIMIGLIKRYAATKNILGVCLGMQAIAEAFDGKLFNLDEVMHGVARKTFIVQQDSLFENVPDEFLSGRYHSWVVEKKSLPDELKIIAVDEQENIMALRHKKYKVKGIQFHPESVLTEYGERMIENWVKE